MLVGFRNLGGSFPASESSQDGGTLVILARGVHNGTGVRVPVMPVIQVIPAECPDGTSGGASSGIGMGVPVMLMCGYQRGVPGKSVVSQWYHRGGPSDPSKEIPVLPVVRSCPSKVRVMQGWIRVKELLIIGVCKYVYVGFI